MDQPEDIEILPGMAGKSTGAPPQLGGAAPVIVEVPLAATFSTGDPDETAVWVIDEGTKTVSRRKVKTGAPTDRGIRITQGLKPGEWIVTAGVNSLRDGQQVTILGEWAE